MWYTICAVNNFFNLLHFNIVRTMFVIDCFSRRIPMLLFVTSRLWNAVSTMCE